MLKSWIAGAVLSLAASASLAQTQTEIVLQYPYPELFTETYIQHSGRSPSGLAAQVENFRRLLASMPDLRLQVEDRIIAGDKVVARNTYSATHTQTIRDIPPTGKAFAFRTIDIWRVENGKFAEHWDLTDVAEALNKLRGG